MVYFEDELVYFSDKFGDILYENIKCIFMYFIWDNQQCTTLDFFSMAPT